MLRESKTSCEDVYNISKLIPKFKNSLYTMKVK